ncbi:hypothetical protein EJP02_281 [Escherichia phage EJP2]|nr:hypothetical protein EJP02_281 [Escherichia phage EJP2]
MKVLTPENKTFDIDMVTDCIPEEMFCVLDLSEYGDSDFYFKHILHTVSFNSISVDLQIGDRVVQIPLGWQILLGDEETGMIEMCTIENLLNMKDPLAYVYNPIRSMYAKFEPIKVLQVYTLTQKWQIPYLQKKNLLCVPLQSGSNPPCAFFADENEKIQDLYLGIGE